jgi:hypothetical protein
MMVRPTSARVVVLIISSRNCAREKGNDLRVRLVRSCFLLALSAILALLFVSGSAAQDRPKVGIVVNLSHTAGIGDVAFSPDGTARYQEATTRPSSWRESATSQMKFFRLAWDLLGSEFTGRHTLYEKFYAGPSFVMNSYSASTAPWDDWDWLSRALAVELRVSDSGSAARISKAQIRDHRGLSPVACAF